MGVASALGYELVLKPETSEETVSTLAKVLVPAGALVTLVFTLGNAVDLVLLALLGSAYVMQLLPALLFSLTANSFVPKWGTAAGILVDVAIVTYLTVAEFTLRAVFPFLGSMGDINVGVVALVANVVVFVAVSSARRTSTATDNAWASADPALKASCRGRS